MGTAVLRQLLLFVHLYAFAFALVTILREDAALLRARTLDRETLAKTKRTIIWLLCILWLIGGTMLVMKNGLNFHAMIAPAKMATKLTVVTLLTINGLLLHWFAFPELERPQRNKRFAATICALLGAVSSASWVYASFVAVSRIIAPQMTYAEYLTIYIGVVLVGSLLSLVIARPRVEQLFSSFSRVTAISTIGNR